MRLGRQFLVGEVLHGFCGGSFGRDSYTCRRVEAVGVDWIVTRNDAGRAEFATGDRLPAKGDGEPEGPFCPYCPF